MEINRQDTANFLESTADAAQYVRHRKCLREEKAGVERESGYPQIATSLLFPLPPFPSILHLYRGIWIQIEICLSTCHTKLNFHFGSGRNPGFWG
jgi:hypothetical protein